MGSRKFSPSRQLTPKISSLLLSSSLNPSNSLLPPSNSPPTLTPLLPNSRRSLSPSENRILVKREALEQLRKNLEKNFFEGRKRPKSPIQMQDGRKKEEGGGRDEGGGRRKFSPDTKSNIFKINTVPNISNKIIGRSKSNERDDGKRERGWTGGGEEGGVAEEGGGRRREIQEKRKERGRKEEGIMREGDEMKNLAVDGKNLSKTGEVKLSEGESKLKIVSLKGLDNFLKMKETSILKNNKVANLKALTPNVSYPKIIKSDDFIDGKEGKLGGFRREDIGKKRKEGEERREDGGGRMDESKRRISYEEIVKDKLLVCEQIQRKELSIIAESVNQGSIDQVQEVEGLAEWEKCVYEIYKVNNFLFRLLNLPLSYF